MSTKTAVPTVKKVKRPTILQPRVHARKTPVVHIQAHHSVENSLRENETCGTTIAIRYAHISNLAETDVGIEGQCHEKDERCVKKDEPGLGNVAVVYRK